MDTNITLRRKILIIAAIIVTALIIVTVYLFLTSGDKTTQQIEEPEQAASLNEFYNFIDDKTRDTLEYNLKLYTQQDLSDFTIKQGSYKESDDEKSFQMSSIRNLSLYDITITPAPSGDYNYVYISCAPDEQQDSRANCMVYTEHHDD